MEKRMKDDRSPATTPQGGRAKPWKPRVANA